MEDKQYGLAKKAGFKLPDSQDACKNCEQITPDGEGWWRFCLTEAGYFKWVRVCKRCSEAIDCFEQLTGRRFV